MANHVVRYRFTATLVIELIINSFQSPHKTLNRYLSTFCKFNPTDGADFSTLEKDINDDSFKDVSPLDFSHS